MPILGLKEARFHLGGPALLNGISFSIDPAERVCLTGRNGVGKTTLLRILQGEFPLDGGEVVRSQGKRIGYLPQELPSFLPGTVADVVREGALVHADEGDWKVDMEAELWAGKSGLPPDKLFSELSGGQKRRALLARALASDPDLLLLDEPTNHLDLESIDWMEEVLRTSRKALLFITHDRAFLRRIATRILELDRGRLLDMRCDWDTFLQRKEALLEEEARNWSEFDKKLGQEEAWARKSPRARRARNEGRARALDALRAERIARRERKGTARLQVQEGQRSSQLVAEAENLSFGYGVPGTPDFRPIITSCSTMIQRGDKVALLGPNGSGKTTLLKLLLGQLQPQGGMIKLGASLTVLYADQTRDQLNLEASVRDNIAGGQEWVEVGGRRKHVMGYLQDFEFEPARALTAASSLSGGERNRLLLAKLFTQPGNVLVLDEPTNDLDMETLSLLEEMLVDFPGTVLVVSHDRDFLDHVAMTTLAIGEDGVVEEFVGGYSEWKRQKEARDERGAREVQEVGGNRKVTPSSSESTSASTPGQGSATKSTSARKLSFKETKEWEELPKLIETLETEQAQLTTKIADPEFYKGSSEEVARTNDRLSALESELEKAYARWEELDGRS
jgi:ATP-binding cassette subfamily F protein uup